MRIKWLICILLLWTSAALSDEPARLVFTSATDFTEISVPLKRARGADPALVEVSVTLTPEAAARVKILSLLAHQKYLTLYIDGYQLSTSKVMSPLGGQFRLMAPRALVVEWMSLFMRDEKISQPTM